MQNLKNLPIGTPVPDNFAPELKSYIVKHSTNGVLLAAPSYHRFVPYWILDNMLYGA